MKSKLTFWTALCLLAALSFAGCSRPVTQGNSSPAVVNPSAPAPQATLVQAQPTPVPATVASSAGTTQAAQAQPATLQPTAAPDLSKEVDDLSSALDGLGQDLGSTDTIDDLK
jgi:hypothetical protein